MRTLYFCPMFSFFYLFFIPLLISVVGDWPNFHTCCGLSANLECRSETCCARLVENTGRKKSPSGHHPTTLSGYIFATKACINNWKNLLSSNISYTCPHKMVNSGLLATEIVSLFWGTPATFNGFRFLAELLHGTLVVGVSQTLRRWTEGATYIRQGGHHVGHWPTFLVCHVLVSSSLTKLYFNIDVKVAA